MSKYAVWNENALTSGLQTSRLVRKYWFLIIAICAVVMVALIAIIPGPFKMLVSVPFSTLLLFKTLHDRKPGASIKRLQDPSSPIPSIPVDIALENEGHLYGQDSGIVSFVDEWLVYEGEDCSFALKASDVRLGFSGDFRDGSQVLRTGEYPYLITLGLLAKDPTSSLVKDVKAWQYGTQEVDGQSLYPPVLPHPSAQNTLKACQRISMWSCILATLLVLSAYVFAAGFLTIGGTGVTLIFMACCFALGALAAFLAIVALVYYRKYRMDLPAFRRLELLSTEPSASQTISNQTN